MDSEQYTEQPVPTFIYRDRDGNPIAALDDNERCPACGRYRTRRGMKQHIRLAKDEVHRIYRESRL